MRLGIFHPAFEAVGGAEILVASQAEILRDEGLAPELVTLAYNPERWAARLLGLPIHLVEKRHWSDLLFGWGRVGKLSQRGKRAADALASFDQVLAHNWPTSAMLGKAPIRARKLWQCNEPPRGIHRREANPTLTARVQATGGQAVEEATQHFSRDLTAYDRAMASFSSLQARKQYDLEGCAGLDVIYAISAFSRDNARRIYGRCEEQVLYPVVRFPQVVAPRSGLDRNTRRVLVHSRLEVLKNIDTVIRGFNLFAASSPAPCELHVVGEGPSRPSLEKLAQDSSPAGSVRFHGFLSEQALQEVYAACDAFALLTLDEPFGMVFPEAAARGLLMVGPDHGGPLEILEDGKLGAVVDAFSPEALSEALLGIWCLDDAEVDRRRTEADRACRSRFDRTAIRPQLLALLGR
ncbi:MAG: glycosyltransferase family 4 protein [Holophagaceae bacterium]|nr:glycosyltransferase family 4 protein [Holophagaceae bacterium]